MRVRHVGDEVDGRENSSNRPFSTVICAGKEVNGMHAAELAMSQEVGKPINMESFDLHQYGDHGLFMQLDQIV